MQFLKIILFLYILAFFCIAGANPSFEHIYLQPGITHFNTKAILQDSDDYLWIGTVFGLVRYDGRQNTYYQHIISDSTSLSANQVTCLTEDNCGNLWVGTRGSGLNRLDLKTGQFRHFRHLAGSRNSLSDDNIQALACASDGKIWVGTQNGLNVLDPCKPELGFKNYFLDLHNVNSISHNSVQSIAVEENGQLWFGTDNGLNRYDPGKDVFERFFHFDSAATYRYTPQLLNYVTRLLEERPPAASLLNITDFQNLADTFKVQHGGTFLIISSGEGYYDYAGQIVNRMYDKGWLESLSTRKRIWEMHYRNTLYAGGGQKNRIKMEMVHLSAGDYRLRYISDDSHSTAHWNHHPPQYTNWYGIQILRVKRSEKNFLTAKLKKRYLQHPNSLSDHTITSILPEPGSNRVWIGTRFGGLNLYNTQTHQFTHFRKTADSDSGLPSDFVTSLLLDKAGFLWVGTDKGLTHFDYHQDTFTTYHHRLGDPYSLSSDEITTLFKDRSGILWAGTNLGSLEKMYRSGKRFTHIRLDDRSGSSINSNNILAIKPADDGAIWVGTYASGVFRYDLQSGKSVHYLVDRKAQNSLDANIVQTVEPGNAGNLWIGTWGGGLISLNVNTGVSKRFTYNPEDPESLPTNYIQTLFTDKQQHLWLATDGYGLCRLNADGQTFTRFSGMKKQPGGLAHSNVYSVYQDKNNQLWFGLANGLARFNEEQNTFSNFKLQSSGGSVSVYDIIPSGDANPNMFWLGTSDGLMQFVTASGQFIRPPRSSFLSGKSILGIERSTSSTLWLSTHEGLIKFHPDSGLINQYDTDDGLQSNVFNMNAHVTMSDGRLVFGGINGINVIDPRTAIENKMVPQVQITAFRVFDELRFPQQQADGQLAITLQHTDNFFSIDFAALDFRRPEKNRYMYRLKGIDKKWQHLKSGNRASYTNIRPGNYIFEVKGTNSDGIWNPKKTKLRIIIVPPFWSRAWFRIILACVFVAALVTVIFAVRRKERRRADLNRQMADLKLQALRARMNPHFIFNTINSIQYFISENANQDAYFYLSKFSKLLRTTLNVSEMASVPLHQEMEILELYLTLQKLRFEDKLNYKLQVADNIDTNHTLIPGMLIQPYVENAIEHGIPFAQQKGLIRVDIKKNGVALICNITDDGIGINQALKDKQKEPTEYRSRGMQLTRERLHIINQSSNSDIDVRITDLSDLDSGQHGTQVTLQIPFTLSESGAPHA